MEGSQQNPESVSPELQKQPTEVRSLCKLTHRDTATVYAKRDNSQAWREGPHCRVCRKASGVGRETEPSSPALPARQGQGRRALRGGLG